MTQDEMTVSTLAAGPSGRGAFPARAAALLLPLLAACKTGGSPPPPTQRPERWPPGGR